MRRDRQPGDGLDAVDRKIVLATQAGLPLVDRPYHAVADRVGLAPEEVMRRLRNMLDRGVIRRIGIVPNHYSLGLKANGMSVWDVEDAEIGRVGPLIGALDFVSHCYHRPRVMPRWPYNLFAMVHGADRVEVSEKVAKIAELLGRHCRKHDLLYSKRILKKTGMRLVG